MAQKLPQLRFLGDPILRQVCKPITAQEFGSPELQRIADELRDTLLAYRSRYKMGRGLAANQIGHAKRMIAVLLGSQVQIMCNPRPLAITGLGSYDESCLSSGSALIGTVHRPWMASFAYQDLAGKQLRLDADAPQTRLVFHENDHLDGIMCTDRYEPRTMRIVSGGVDEILGSELMQLS